MRTIVLAGVRRSGGSLVCCKFDARGEATACGVAVIDEQNDEITVVTASD